MKFYLRGLILLIFGLLGWLCAEIAPGDPAWPETYPDWWYKSGDPANGLIDVTKPVLNEGNLAPLTLAQLKHMASEARDELDEQLAAVGGAGSAIDTMVDGFAVNDPANLAPATLGQLKAVASKFYDRFAVVGFVPSSLGWPDGMELVDTTGVVDNSPWYPWLEDQTPDNLAIAAIAQAKYLFSWSLDQWSPIVGPAIDSDGDGLTDAEEAAFGSNPNLIHSDSDTLTDYQEFHLGTDPNSADVVIGNSNEASDAVVWRLFK